MMGGSKRPDVTSVGVRRAVSLSKFISKKVVFPRSNAGFVLLSYHSRVYSSELADNKRVVATRR